MTNLNTAIAHQANQEILTADKRAERVFQAHKDEYNGEVLYTILFADYGHLVLEYLEQGEIDKAKIILDFIEKYAASNDKLLRESATTGFLEAIDHRITDESYKNQTAISHLKNMLGKESLAYCQAYEKFMTKGTGQFWK